MDCLLVSFEHLTLSLLKNKIKIWIKESKKSVGMRYDYRTSILLIFSDNCQTLLMNITNEYY